MMNDGSRSWELSWHLRENSLRKENALLGIKLCARNSLEKRCFWTKHFDTTLTPFMSAGRARVQIESARVCLNHERVVF
jgi:hypothetical protein